MSSQRKNGGLARRRYFAFAASELKNAFAYRGAMALSFAAEVIRAVVIIAVWMAVYRGRSTVAGFSYPMMMTYLIVSQTVNLMHGFDNDASRPVINRINRGTIGFELLRPVDFTAARLFENIGQTIVEAAFAIIVFCAFALIMPDAVLFPATAFDAATFVISLLLGYIIMFCTQLISGLYAFRLMNGWGIRNVRDAIVSFFSGALVPLQLLPQWLRGACDVLPFKGIVYTPTMLYMGVYGREEALIQLALQLVWAVALWAAMRLLFKTAVKHVSINGG